MKNTIKINLGCGNKYLQGYINCDYVKSLNVDKVFDLNKFPYPFKDNFADEILMDNVLEHLDDIVKVMEEIYRILKIGSVVKVYVPYGKSDWAMQDPTHKHFFTERSMNYFDDKFEYSYYSKARFKIMKAYLFCDTSTRINKFRSLIPLKSLLRYYFYNIYDGVYFELKKI